MFTPEKTMKAQRGV